MKASKNYFKKEYNPLDRWISYYYQINLLLEIPKIEKKKILEIGVGNKLVSDYLKKVGINIKTLDINKNLEPDFVGDVRNLPFEDNEFDIIICYEVLEHIPRKELDLALKELNRVSSQVILSLPYSGFCLSGYFKFPFNKGRVFRIPSLIYRPESLVRKLGIEHYWTLGEINSTVPKIKKIIKKNGFKIIKEVIPVLNSHHQFFVMKRSRKTRP